MYAKESSQSVELPVAWPEVAAMPVSTNLGGEEGSFRDGGEKTDKFLGGEDGDSIMPPMHVANLVGTRVTALALAGAR